MLLTALVAAAAILAPPVHGRFDYQIGGAYPPDKSVRIVDRDWHDRPAVAVYSICYVNAFQTQPEADRWWRRHHPHLLLRDHGHVVGDPGWPGEYLLDTATARHRIAIAHILGSWINACERKGFAAVEPDNLDSYTRSHHLLTAADNFGLAKLLVARAHADGLAVAQKNTADQSRRGRTKTGFDFAIAEECQVYSECAAYRAAYGHHVIEVEYTDNARHYFSDACRARGDAISVVLRDREVVPRGRPGYVEQWC